MKIFRVFIAVVCIGAIKLTVTQGMSGNISAYVQMLKTLSVVEVAIWFLIALSGVQAIENSLRFSNTHAHRTATRLVEKEDGTTEEIVTTSWAQTSSYDGAKKALRFSKISFVSAVTSLLFYYLYIAGN